MSSTDDALFRENFRWRGGLSHVNSSQKGIYHWNVVEIAWHERVFYGCHLTASQAEQEAKAKLDLFHRIRQTHKEDVTESDYAELLCGHAGCPSTVYRDPLPSKDQLTNTGQQAWLGDRRMAAIMEPNTQCRSATFNPDPRVQRIRSFIAGISEERMRSVKKLFRPEEEYWDGSELPGKANAWQTLKWLMEGCQPPILYAAKACSPKGTNTPIFEHRLKIFDCELVSTAETDDMAKQQVALTFLLWIRRQTLDLLVDESPDLPTSIPVALNRRIPLIVADLVLARLTGVVKLMDAAPGFPKERAMNHIAALVIQEMHTFRVIALAGGSGCILSKKDDISKDSAGFLLKDCHAEILVLRCAKLFLYDQLELFFSRDMKRSSLSMFTVGPNGSIVIKHGIGLHLYVGQKPCGRAGMLHPQVSPQTDRNPFGISEKTGTSHQARSFLTGNQDDSLRIMSCCDKIQKRSFVGIQGHLLSQLMLPAYLGLVVVGSAGGDHSGQCFGVDSVLEAKYPLMVRGKESPFGFDVVSPLVVSARAPPSLGTNGAGITFCQYADRVSGKTLLEYLDPRTGRQTNGAFSMLCKRALFLRFRSLYDSIPPEHLPSTATLNPRFRGTYFDCKNASIDYLAQKQIFLSVLKQALPSQSPWIKKNPLSEKFTCVLEPKPPNYTNL